jgi:hypothetical protein
MHGYSTPAIRNGCGSDTVISVRLTVRYVLALFSHKSEVSFFRTTEEAQ